MKVISTTYDDKELGMFDIGIKFKAYKGNEFIDNEKYLNEICDWISKTFTKNFVIIEHADTIVAGGWSDNKRGWASNNFKVNRGEHSRTATYELRCHDIDSTAFLMKWQS